MSNVGVFSLQLQSPWNNALHSFVSYGKHAI